MLRPAIALVPTKKYPELDNNNKTRIQQIIGDEVCVAYGGKELHKKSILEKKNQDFLTKRASFVIFYKYKSCQLSPLPVFIRCGKRSEKFHSKVRKNYIHRVQYICR